MSWRPRRLRESADEHADYDGPHEGVPDWIRDQLLNWASDNYDEYEDSKAVEKLRWTVSVLRLKPLAGSYSAPMRNDLLTRMANDQELFLDILDFHLAYPEIFSNSRSSDLDAILVVGGSVYEVGTLNDEQQCLQRRVSEAVKGTLDEALQPDTQAAHTLREGWNHAFGRNPVPKSAYDAAIRAVESVLVPVVCPNNTAATLGSAIGEIGANPGLYGFRVEPNPPAGSAADPVAMVRTMAQVLWQGYEGRHGDGSQGPGPVNTLDQAQDAIHLAALLVQWCQSGAFFRR